MANGQLRRTKWSTKTSAKNVSGCNNYTKMQNIIIQIKIFLQLTHEIILLILQGLLTAPTRWLARCCFPIIINPSSIHWHSLRHGISHKLVSQELLWLVQLLILLIEMEGHFVAVNFDFSVHKIGTCNGAALYSSKITKPNTVLFTKLFVCPTVIT